MNKRLAQSALDALANAPVPTEKVSGGYRLAPGAIKMMNAYADLRAALESDD